MIPVAYGGDGKFTLVPQGGVVPFEATCFDTEATAKLLTWKEFLAVLGKSFWQAQGRVFGRLWEESLGVCVKSFWRALGRVSGGSWEEFTYLPTYVTLLRRC